MTKMQLESSIRKYLLRASIPVQHLIDKVGKPDPLATDEQYLAMRGLVKNGSVLLAHDTWKGTNVLIPGFWKHAAIYCDGYVYEAVGIGVRKVLFERFVLQKDDLFMGSPMFPINDVRLKWFLEQQNGKPYDFEFETEFMDMPPPVAGVVNIEDLNFKITNEKAWYCAELVYGALKFASRPEDFNLKLQMIMGEETLPPQGLREQVGTALTYDYLAKNSTTKDV